MQAQWIMIVGTHHMTCQSEYSFEQYMFGNCRIYLISECMNWQKSNMEKVHKSDCIFKTMSRNIGIMNKLKTLFIPEHYLNYGILIWGNMQNLIE